VGILGLEALQDASKGLGSLPGPGKDRGPHEKAKGTSRPAVRALREGEEARPWPAGGRHQRCRRRPMPLAEDSHYPYACRRQTPQPAMVLMAHLASHPTCRCSLGTGLPLVVIEADAPEGRLTLHKIPAGGFSPLPAH